MVLKKAKFAIRAYRLYSAAWDWWQTVRKAWRERHTMETKTSWISKINWIAFGNILVNAFDMLGRVLTAEDQAQIISLFSGDMAANWASIFISVVIIIVRSYFTTKLTKGSVK